MQQPQSIQNERVSASARESRDIAQAFSLQTSPLRASKVCFLVRTKRYTSSCVSLSPLGEQSKIEMPIACTLKQTEQEIG